MEHVYLTMKDVNTAYEMKYITRRERDELIKRVQADNSKIDRRARYKK